MAYRRLTGGFGDAVHLAKWAGASLIRNVELFINRKVETQPNLILFESFAGVRADCNPRAIFEYLQERYNDEFEYVWAVKEPNKWYHLAKRPHTTVVKYRSPEYYHYAIMANVAVFNAAQGADYPARNSQLQIQTWHGVPYKTIGSAQHDAPRILSEMEARKFSRYNYVVSACRHFSSEIRRGFSYQGNFLECGMPRNDRLVVQSKNDIDSCRDALGLRSDDYLVLFAPTWCDTGSAVEVFDVERIRVAFEKAVGKHVIMASRGHLHSDGISGAFDYDYSDYEDITSLLIASNAVISDYSSLIWDFSLTFRPCFLFTPNIDQYEREHGFTLDIHNCGFPVCKSNSDLEYSIYHMNYNEYCAAISRHHASLGSFEHGRACEAVSSIIKQHCEKRVNQ